MADGANLRTRALGHLARREHTRAELRRKLAPVCESAEQLELLLDDLASRQLLSDVRYAEQRVCARGQRLGNARLKQELKNTGVDDGLIAEVLQNAGNESDRARAVWERKFGNAATDRNERAKQVRFLQSRGFSTESIRKVMKDASERHGDE